MQVRDRSELDLFTDLNAFLADHDLRGDPCEPAWDWIGQLTCAGCMRLHIVEESGTVDQCWGLGESEPGWQLRFPLARVGGGSEITLSGAGSAPDSDGEARARAVCGLVDTHLAAQIALGEERSQRVLAESLVEISRVLSSSLDLEKILEQILSRLVELVPFDSASVMLLTDGQLYMHAAIGYQDSSGPIDVSKVSFVPSRTVMMEEVLGGNQSVIISDTKDIPNWLWTPTCEHVRSWLAVPLQVKGQVIGLFSIDKSTPNFFTQRHAELAQALAAHAALALNNARMFAQISETQEQLCGLSAQVIEAQENERQKIAVELHDHAGQALLGLRAELQILKHYIPPGSDQAVEQICYLDEVVLEICQDLRQLAHDLRPPILTELGLVPALEQYLDEFSRRMKMPATFEFEHEREISRIPANIELICYRIVQEALTNLAKHAQATKAKITLALAPERLTLSVIDDGVGFSPYAKKVVDGFGLIGIRERVTAVGGQMQIYSQPGRGTQISVEIPLDAADEPR